MRFPPHILDEIRARVPVSAVVARKVALKKTGREFAGLSPFKAEKTPSFFVNDQKGFYHCFASGEHGDIFTFLIKTEGLSFPEAVERLAQEAGVTLPKPTARDVQLEDRRDRLYRLLEVSAELFEQHLQSAQGRNARDYLAGRGLNAETCQRFRIGYASNGRTALLEALKQRGFTLDEIATAGMVIAGADIARPYDRFRDRVMFPITDLKGRVIAFGGRALDPDQPAKYLNSPETPLFHKGSILFNAPAARRAAHDTGELLVVEGYMDVVALDQAGIRHAVAPLGTALTTDQIGLLWRVASEPVLCFDGDTAGRKAAHRALDVALPLLTAGRSLRFAFMPDGLDPDDLVRRHGPQALTKVIATAKPMGEVLWERAWNADTWTTPERRALLERQLHEQIGKIADAGVRAHYQRDIRDRLYKAWRNPAARARTSAHYQSHGGERHRQRTEIKASGAIRQSSIVSATDVAPLRLEAELLRLLCHHPDLLEEFAEDIAALRLSNSELSAFRDELLGQLVWQKSLDTTSLRNHLEKSRWKDCLLLVERTAPGHRLETGTVENSSALSDAMRSLVARLSAGHQLKIELDEAVRDFDATGSEDDWLRIFEIKQQMASLEAMQAQ